MSLREFLRVPLFAALSLLAVLPSPEALAEAKATQLLFLEQSQAPSKVRWTRALQDPNPGADQGYTTACWAFAGADILTAVLRQHHVLQSDETLSPEYYFMVVAYHFGFNHRSESDSVLSLMPRGEPSSFLEVLKNVGILTQRDFIHALPSGDALEKGLASKTFDTAFKSYQYDLRTVRNRRDYDATFEKYFGSVLHSKTPLRDEATRRVLRSIQVREVERKTSRGEPAEGIDRLLSIVKRQLDQGIPGYIGVYWNSQELDRIGEKSATSDQRDLLRPDYSSTHGMTVLGYRADASGDVTELLVKNTWGPSYAEQGKFTAGRDFLEKYLAHISQVTISD